jgi:DNA modification methylase
MVSTLHQSIHPFPARMAPEVALAQCRDLPRGSVVLDPMTGSGTVLRAAADAGLHAIGYDVDPLAVLMTRVWTTPIDCCELLETARRVLVAAEAVSPDTHLPWIDDDPETTRFVEYWFGAEQRRDLRRLSAVLADHSGPTWDALRIALSRLIVTKDSGASLARDVSHSRPHRVRTKNTFEVLPAFLRSAQFLGTRLSGLSNNGCIHVKLGDARNLSDLHNASVDAVITSPPYLNALDYLRGHRLSLVWLGYRIGELRAIRAESIGTERMLDSCISRETIALLAPRLGPLDELPCRSRGMIDRFLIDLHSVLKEIRRVLRTNGRATFVIGNSCIRNVFIDNAAAIVAAAELLGFILIARMEREIPPARRYLPPPSERDSYGVKHRMRTEVVLTFAA